MGSVIPMKKKICKVLVVEDDSGIRELLTDVFESEGYHFVLAGNAEEMRAAMAGAPDIDILIVDLRLPGGDSGLFLAQASAVPGLPGILASGGRAHLGPLAHSGPPRPPNPSPPPPLP